MKLFNKVMVIAAVAIFATGVVDCNAMKKNPFEDIKDSKAMVDKFKDTLSPNLDFKKQIEAMQLVTQMNTAIAGCKGTFTSDNLQAMIQTIDDLIKDDSKEPHQVFFKKFAKVSLGKLKTAAEQAEAKVATLKEGNTTALQKFDQALAKYQKPNMEALAALEQQAARIKDDIEGLEGLATEAVNGKKETVKALIAVKAGQIQAAVEGLSDNLAQAQTKLLAFVQKDDDAAGEDEEEDE